MLPAGQHYLAVALPLAPYGYYDCPFTNVPKVVRDLRDPNDSV